MNEKILERIKKCLALANSGNEHEAAEALRRAQTLMNQYGINEQEIQFSSLRSEVSKSKVQAKPSLHYATLINVIAKAFGVKPVLTYHDKAYRVEFSGVDYAVEIATYSFDVCMRELSVARKSYIERLHGNCKKQTKTIKADMYCQGWVKGVKNNVPPLVVDEGHFELIEQYCSYKHGSLVDSNISDRHNDKYMNDYMNGLEDGNNYHVRTPVSSHNEKKLLI